MLTEPIALIFESQEHLVNGFTEYFFKLLHGKNGIFNVALSGGSTPKIWFDNLARHHANEPFWGNIHFYWGDERCVAPDDADSNFGMTKRYLFDRVPVPAKNIHRIHGELPPEDAAELYEKDLRQNLGETPVFDLLILGMGDDGHTASIFPNEIKLWNSDRLCVVAMHPLSGQKRVSLTGKVINAAAAVAFLVTGEKKQERVREIINQEPIAVYYPASLVSPGNGTLHWFLDKAAANQLDA